MAEHDFGLRLESAYDCVRGQLRDKCSTLRHDDWSLIRSSQKVIAYHVQDAINGIPIDWFFRGCLPEFDMPFGRINDRPFDLLIEYNLTPLMTYIQEQLYDFNVEISEDKSWVMVIAKLQYDRQRYCGIRVSRVNRMKHVRKHEHVHEYPRGYEHHDEYARERKRPRMDLETYPTFIFANVSNIV